MLRPSRSWPPSLATTSARRSPGRQRRVAKGHVVSHRQRSPPEGSGARPMQGPAGAIVFTSREVAKRNQQRFQHRGFSAACPLFFVEKGISAPEILGHIGVAVNRGSSTMRGTCQRGSIVCGPELLLLEPFGDPSETPHHRHPPQRIGRLMRTRMNRCRP